MLKLIKKCQNGSYLSYNSNGIVSEPITKTNSSGVKGGGGTMNTIGNVLDIANNIIPGGSSPEGQTYSKLQDTIASAAMSVPYLGIILQAGNLLGKGLNFAGLGTDQVTTEDAIFDNGFVKSLTPGGWVNTLTRGKAKSILGDPDSYKAMATLGSGYGNVMDQYDYVKDKTGKVMGNALGQLSRWNGRISNLNSQLQGLLDVYEGVHNNESLTAQMEDRWNQATENDLNGFSYIYQIKHGMKLDLDKLNRVKRLASAPKVVDVLGEFKDEEVQEFKEGGKMNVIPEGSLHARLHHMENAEGLTKKGIPVVSIAEGGEFEQQAEIELNEIIFNLDVTTELEKLMQDGSDNAAIEAGKLLVKEIFENTDDRTGLIKQLEPEKKESTTEDIVKNHQVFQEGGNIKPSFEEWYKTVPKDRNNIENYNLKRAYELAPWEELERWRTATPEQLNDDKYHLKTFYWNDKGEGEFVKKNGHPTLIKELEAYFTNKDFREKYDLDMSGDYFKYIKRNND